MFIFIILGLLLLGLTRVGSVPDDGIADFQLRCFSCACAHSKLLEALLYAPKANPLDANHRQLNKKQSSRSATTATLAAA